MLVATVPPPEITTTLDRGERVIWSGQPRQGLAFRGIRKGNQEWRDGGGLGRGVEVEQFAAR